MSHRKLRPVAQLGRYIARVCLALGNRDFFVGGRTAVEARNNALRMAARDDWHPSAVMVTPRWRKLPRCSFGRWSGRPVSTWGETWFSRSVPNPWERGLWCPGCERFTRRPKIEAMGIAYCKCGDALWLSPFDPGPGGPAFYSRQWRRQLWSEE